MLNKRGQGMSTNAIILIVLGIVVLVVLILGFTMGWGKLAPWLSANNVDTIVTACEASCATGASFDFCLSTRNLKAEDVKLKDVTCNYLAKYKARYGIATCSSLPCINVLVVEESSVVALPNHCEEVGQVVQALIGDTLESYECTV